MDDVITVFLFLLEQKPNLHSKDNSPVTRECSSLIYNLFVYALRCRELALLNTLLYFVNSLECSKSSPTGGTKVRFP